MANHKQKLVEVTRAFSYKLNVGNFESRDFFCSQKAEVPLVEAEQISELLHDFCKNEVVKSVNKYKQEFLPPTNIEKVKKWLSKEEEEAKQSGLEKREGDYKEAEIKAEEKENLPIISIDG